MVVFCTVENDLAHIREALDAGANEYIMKPFDGDIIAAKFVEAGPVTAEDIAQVVSPCAGPAPA